MNTESASRVGPCAQIAYYVDGLQTMLLRQKRKQNDIPMTFFFWRKKVCRHKVISVFIRWRNP